MVDGDDADVGDEGRRQLLRGVGVLAGGLATLGASGSASATGGPTGVGYDRLPVTGERVGEAHSTCADDAPTEPSASDPNERYRQLLEQGLDMRVSNEPSIAYGAIQDTLRERNGGFDGDLILFAASDFGEPRVFLPSSLSNQDAALQAILDRVHEQKWRARNAELRTMRNEIFENGNGVHQVLAALYRGSGDAAYDIDFPWNRTYNFVTIRQAVGLVDWVTNARDPWLDGLRRTY